MQLRYTKKLLDTRRLGLRYNGLPQSLDTHSRHQRRHAKTNNSRQESSRRWRGSVSLRIVIQKLPKLMALFLKPSKILVVWIFTLNSLDCFN